MPFKDPEIRKLKQREYNKRWREQHPEWAETRKSLPSYGNLYGSRPTDEAAAAHEAVKRAVRRGELVRPTTCSKCGREGFIEAAHDDYRNQLIVTWLCRSCHRQRDASQPNHGRTTEPRKGRKRVTVEERRAYRAAWMREWRRKQRAASE